MWSSMRNIITMPGIRTAPISETAECTFNVRESQETPNLVLSIRYERKEIFQLLWAWALCVSEYNLAYNYSILYLQVTIIAKNINGVLSPYQIRSTRLELVHRGVKSPEEVINSEKRSNKLLTWGLRFGGWILMYLGLSIMTKIVKTLGKILTRLDYYQADYLLWEFQNAI